MRGEQHLLPLISRLKHLKFDLQKVTHSTSGLSLSLMFCCKLSQDSHTLVAVHSILAFSIHCSHETPSHSQPISLWCIRWSTQTIIFHTHSNCIFFFFLVASQLCKWCDCMLLLPRLINECTWKFAKILLWSTCGLPGLSLQVSKSVSSSSSSVGQFSAHV